MQTKTDSRWRGVDTIKSLKFGKFYPNVVIVSERYGEICYDRIISEHKFYKRLLDEINWHIETSLNTV